MLLQKGTRSSFFGKLESDCEAECAFPNNVLYSDPYQCQEGDDPANADEFTTICADKDAVHHA